MFLDAQTLFVVLAAAMAVSTLALWMAWRRNPEVPALRWWIAAFATVGVGVILLGLRGRIPQLVSIDVGNAMVLAGGGLVWTGARAFSERRVILPLAVAGAAIWLLACRVAGFYEWDLARVTLASTLSAFYGFAAAFEFWRGTQRLSWRLPAVALLTIHGATYLLRIPLAAAFPVRVDGLDANPGLAVIIFEAIIFAFAGTFILLAMAKERVELAHRAEAFIDPLTGVANRRAFLADARAIIEGSPRRRRSSALLLFDLDRFKQINDTRGHETGDRVLELFCAVATATLRANDRFGRLGGEEFAAVLADVTATEARAIAGRILSSFAEATRDNADLGGEATASVGVAVSSGSADLTELMRQADRALYRAKDLGRNRVEGPPTLSPKPARAA